MPTAVEAEALPLELKRSCTVCGCRHSSWPSQLGATQRVAAVVTLSIDGALSPADFVTLRQHPRDVPTFKSLVRLHRGEGEGGRTIFTPAAVEAEALPLDHRGCRHTQLVTALSLDRRGCRHTQLVTAFPLDRPGCTHTQLVTALSLDRRDRRHTQRVTAVVTLLGDGAQSAANSVTLKHRQRGASESCEVRAGDIRDENVAYHCHSLFIAPVKSPVKMCCVCSRYLPCDCVTAFYS